MTVLINRISSRLAPSFMGAIIVATAGFLFTAGCSQAAGPEGFADLAEELTPAVVNISTTQTVRGGRGFLQLPPGSPYEEWFEEFMDRFGSERDGEVPEREVTSLGSGFIIDEDGIVVTNNHVVEKADEITVILSDGTELPAEVLGRDQHTDLAVLRVENDEPLPAVSFGDSETARVGDWVIAIGNPYGLGGSVTAGIISARGRNINAGPYDDFIQVDAPINRGNSGGPLFNMDGEVIGINTAIFSPSGGNIGIGFAVPSSMAEGIVAELIEKGEVERGWLGVQIQGVTEEIAESLGLDEAKGVLIAQVFEGDPADRAGIQPGDVIIEYNEQEIEGPRDLQRIVAETPVDERVPVIVLRDGKRERLFVQVGRMEDEQSPIARAEEDDTGRSILGMELAALSDEVRARYNIPEEIEEGVIVVDIDSGSEAWKKGVRRGHIIEQAQFKTVNSPADVAEAVKRLREEGKENITLGINNGDVFGFVGVSLEEEDD